MLNTTNFSNLLYGQTFLKDTISSVLKFGVRLLLIVSINALMDTCFLSGTNFSIHFSFPLNLAIHRIGSAPNILCPRCKEQKDSHPHFIFYCKLSKTNLDFVSVLNNLNYSFNIPFKASLKNPLEALFLIP